MGVEVFGLVAGLGFVLSFGYWCTDFLVVQRAMAADSMSAARRTPLIAAVPENDDAVHRDPAGHRRAGAGADGRGLRRCRMKDGGHDYDQVLTTLMAQVLSRRACWASGSPALMASFMSGMAGNVTAFNTVFTYDIYQSYIRKGAPDATI